MLRRSFLFKTVNSKDVQFLRSIHDRMQKDKLKVYKPGSNRNAYAMVLRFKGQDGFAVSRMFAPHEINTLKPIDIINKLDSESKENHPSSLTLFFLRQKDTEEHRWSSSIIFPGGKRDNEEDKNDLEAVRRHAYCQLGIPLKGQFVLLGQLPDIWNYSRDLEGGTMNARFVFLHVGDMTPTLQLSGHIVKSTAWVPISLLTRSNVSRDRVKHQFYSYLRSGSVAHREVRDAVSNTMMYFPSVQLPGDLGEHFGDVWGSTLSWASTLLAYDRRRRLDWPVVTTDSFFLQHFVIYPFHGYLELRDHEVCEGEPLNALHVSCLGMVSFIVFWFFYAAAYVFFFSLYVCYTAMVEGGGRAQSEVGKETVETGAAMKVKNFFNIPWHLLAPRTVDDKIGAPTEQENKEIIETKIMFNKLVKQVEEAPIPKGGAVVLWNDSYKNPVVVGAKGNETYVEDVSENPDVQSTISSPMKVSGLTDEELAVRKDEGARMVKMHQQEDLEEKQQQQQQQQQKESPIFDYSNSQSEAEYYASQLANKEKDDARRMAIETARANKREKDAKEKESRDSFLAGKKISPTATTTEYGSGIVHTVVGLGSGFTGFERMAAEARERKLQYDEELAERNRSKESRELDELVKEATSEQFVDVKETHNITEKAVEEKS